jgi:hypothetical protein
MGFGAFHPRQTLSCLENAAARCHLQFESIVCEFLPAVNLGYETGND